MTERTKQALRNFAAGYNCAQSVYMAYADVAGLTQEQAARVSAGFGGGIGRLRDNCGAFSAAVMLCINLFVWNFSSICLMLLAAAVSLCIFLLQGSAAKKGGAKQ